MTELYPTKDRPFVGNFVRTIAKGLTNDFRVVVVSPQLLRWYRGFGYFSKRFYRDDDIIVYRFPEFSLLQLSLRLAGFLDKYTFVKQAKQRIRRKLLLLTRSLHAKYAFSIVHGHECFVGDEATEIGNHLQIPSIITVHALRSYHEENFGSAVLQQFEENLRKTTKVTTVSRLAQSSYESATKTQNFVIIPNALDETILQRGAAALPPISQPPVALSVGFLTKQKNQAAAIASLCAAPTLRLIVVGNGELRKNLERYAKNLGVSSRVTFHEKCSPHEIYELYKRSSFLLHPSLSDSFSQVCAESMAFGRPIICTNKTGISEYITQGKEGYIVQVNDQAALNTAVAKLAASPTLREEMGAAARKLSQTTFWLFAVLFTALLIAEVSIMAKQIRIGPKH